jgi:hypothetical protein
VKYIWRGSNSGITAYSQTPKQVDIRLVKGKAVEIPDDDSNLSGWISNQIGKGNLTEAS